MTNNRHPVDGSMHTSRRQFMAMATAFGASAALPGFAQASDDYPSRPIRYIVAYPPGGTSDVIARQINPALAKRFGQPVVIENKPGAGGVVGTDALAKSPPDGYALAYISNSFLTVSPQLMNTPYDPFKDVEPVAYVGTNINVLGVNPALPVKNIAELIAYGKANPGKLFFGSSGNGSGGHITCEYFCRKAGIEAVHVPYRGAGPAIVDLIGGRLSFMIDSGLMPSIRAGQVRPLGIATKVERTGELAQLPFIADHIAGWDCPDFYNFIIMPANTPLAIRERVRTTFEEVLNDQELIQKLRASSYEIGRMDMDALRKRLRGEHITIGQVIKDARIQL